MAAAAEAPPAGAARGAVWLLADMSLNVWALAIVKAAGTEVTAVQLVFLRALVGLLVMAPWILLARRDFARARGPGLHLARVALSALTLTTSFFAVARLPFALFTAVNFTRPLVMIAMAALFLAEPATPRRWLAALVGLAGVVLALGPAGLAPDPALLALALAVVSGTAAIVVTRKLVRQPPVVLMSAYTAGIALATAPFALLTWTPLSAADGPVLLLVGVFAQAAQFCFLRAHRLASAGLLAILGYASLVLSTGVGWTLFGEVPRPGFWAGAALIVAATWAARRV